jgi:hypothetical protein
MEHLTHTSDPRNALPLAVDDPDHPWVAGMIETMADAPNMASARSELSDAMQEGRVTPEDLESLSRDNADAIARITTSTHGRSTAAKKAIAHLRRVEREIVRPAIQARSSRGRTMTRSSRARVARARRRRATRVVRVDADDGDPDPAPLAVADTRRLARSLAPGAAPLTITDRTCLEICGLEARPWKRALVELRVPYARLGHRTIARGDDWLAAIDGRSGRDAPVRSDDEIVRAVLARRK